MGRVSHTQATSDVAATAASIWILAATASSYILAGTASSQPSNLEFQHSCPTFRPRMLATTIVGTSSWRASSAMGNPSVDELYVMYLCHKTTTMYYCVNTIWIVDLCLVV
jgi:hypothetical protein